MATATAPRRIWVAPRQTVADYVALTKPGIILLTIVPAFTAIWLASPKWPSLSMLLITLLGTTLAAGSANALNCYWDRDIDAVMLRTQRRPLPAGRLQPVAALRFAIVLGVISFGLLAWQVNLVSALLGLSGILFYVLVYTMWLKRSTPQNIVIGGAAGAVPPLIGWAAVTGQVELPAVLLFLIIFLWTPPHFWALALYKSDDYRRANIPMLPVVSGEKKTKRQIVFYSFLMVVSTLTPPLLNVAGPLYFAVAVVLGIAFIIKAFQVAKDVTDRSARKLFGYSILYLGLLFLVMIVSRMLDFSL